MVVAHFMGGVSLPLFRAPQSMLRSQGWLLMSLTPDTRQPYRLLRSTCSRAAGDSIRCLTPPPSEAPAHMRPAVITSAAGGSPQRLPVWTEQCEMCHQHLKRTRRTCSSLRTRSRTVTGKSDGKVNRPCRIRWYVCAVSSS